MVNVSEEDMQAEHFHILIKATWGPMREFVKSSYKVDCHLPNISFMPWGRRVLWTLPCIHPSLGIYRGDW